MSKRKTKLESKKSLALVESYLNGDGSGNYLAKSARTSYNTHLKIQAVNDYLNGAGSLYDISKKYGLRDIFPLRS